MILVSGSSNLKVRERKLKAFLELMSEEDLYHLFPNVSESLVAGKVSNKLQNT